MNNERMRLCGRLFSRDNGLCKFMQIEADLFPVPIQSVSSFVSLPLPFVPLVSFSEEIVSFFGLP